MIVSDIYMFNPYLGMKKDRLTVLLFKWVENTEETRIGF